MDNKTPPQPLVFTPAQRRLVSAALACISAGVILAFVSGLIWLLDKFLAVASPALWPVILAWVLSLLLQPTFAFLETRLRFPRIVAICALYVTVAAACVLIAACLLPAMLRQASAFIGTLPELWQSAWETFSQQVPEDVRGWLTQLGLAPETADAGRATLAASADAAKTATPAATATARPDAALVAPGAAWIKSVASTSLSALATAGAGLQAFFVKAGGLAIVPVYLFYLLSMRRDFLGDANREARFLPEGLRNDMLFLARQFAGILTAYFRGQLLVGLLLGVFLALGWTLVGLKFGLLLGLAIGLLNMVPFLGTMLGFCVMFPLAYFQADGGSMTLIGGCVVLLLGMLLESLVLTPKIMSNKMSLHPMAVTFSVFFWGLILDGLLGMVLAVPLTAFFVVFWRLLKSKYLPQQTEADRA